jgi:hypothetical protein
MKRNLTVLAAVTASLWSLTACSAMAKTQSDGIAGIKGASELQCNQARREYEQAIDNFSILEGRPPKDETELVPKYIMGVSELVDVAPDGTVVVQPGGACS